MKYAMLCSALALFVVAATAEAGGPGQRFSGGYYGGNYYGRHQGGGLFGGGHHYNGGHYGNTPGWDISPNANYYAQWYGHGYNGAFGVPAVASPAYVPGPPTAAVTYPYYTVRGPRDFLLDNPPSLGP